MAMVTTKVHVWEWTCCRQGPTFSGGNREGTVKKAQEGLEAQLEASISPGSISLLSERSSGLLQRGNG